MNDSNVRTIATTLHGRYLLERVGSRASRLLLVGFHGYAQNAEAILGPLRAIAAPAGATVAAIQGLHRFYSRSQQQVVASWMTREDRELMLADNLEYVGRVIDATRAEAGTDANLILVGFSQGTAMAWRTAAAHPAPVIALGGDIPPEVTPEQLSRVPAALLGAGSLDEWYTGAKQESDLARLAAAGCPGEGVAFEGGHEWATEFTAACQRFVNRLAPPEQERDSSV